MNSPGNISAKGLKLAAAVAAAAAAAASVCASLEGAARSIRSAALAPLLTPEERGELADAGTPLYDAAAGEVDAADVDGAAAAAAAASFSFSRSSLRGIQDGGGINLASENGGRGDCLLLSAGEAVDVEYDDGEAVVEASDFDAEDGGGGGISFESGIASLADNAFFAAFSIHRPSSAPFSSFFPLKSSSSSFLSSSS